MNAFTPLPPDVREIRHFHLFCGLGGGAKGFNKASPRVGNMVGRFRCIGGIDVNAPAIRDFERLSGGVRGTVLDLFDRAQFRDFHGIEPPASWREAGPAEIRAAAGGEYPHIVFLSAPCKGFSGLLNETKSKTQKYQALNRLTLRAYGYAVAETTHDCGVIGGLAQSRKRFLLVARHIEKVPPFLYEPEQKRLQAVGTVLDRMPLPGDLAGGPMHRIPALQWKTWVRLAFVEAGSDWRSLNKLAVEDGVLRDFLIVPEYHHGYLGVNRWDEHSGTVAGRSTPSNGAFSIADPRFAQSEHWNHGQAYGVLRSDQSAGAVAGQQAPGQGYYSVADPRHTGPDKHSNEFRIVPFDRHAVAVTSAHGSGQAVADPRAPQRENYKVSKYKVTSYANAANAVIGASHAGDGAFAVADPRPNGIPEKGDHYLTGGHYGVVPFASPSGAVSAAACHDNGRWSVADPRMPEATDKLVTVIRSLDGTWHRPFTTIELAALQSLVEPEEQLELDGLSDSDWRERIGNAVPPDAAEAIAGVMGTTLLLAWSGETFLLSATPIWVRPVAVALTVAQGGQS